MRNIGILVIIVFSLLIVSGCSNKKETNQEQTLNKVSIQIQTVDSMKNLSNTEIIKKYNVKEFIPYTLNKDSLSLLCVSFVYYHGYENNDTVISNTFESIEYLYDNSNETKSEFCKQKANELIHINNYDEINYSYFFLEDTISVKNSKYLIASFKDYNGFESIPFVFALFEKQSDKLVLNGLFKKLFSGSIGYVIIDNIKELPNDTFIISFSSQSNDDNRGRIEKTYYHWIKPLTLNPIYTINLEWYSDDFIDRKERTEDSLDIVNMNLIVKKIKNTITYKNQKKVSEKDQILNQDTINYKRLLNIY